MGQACSPSDVVSFHDVWLLLGVKQIIEHAHNTQKWAKIQYIAVYLYFVKMSIIAELSAVNIASWKVKLKVIFGIPIIILLK